MERLVPGSIPSNASTVLGRTVAGAPYASPDATAILRRTAAGAPYASAMPSTHFMGHPQVPSPQAPVQPPYFARPQQPFPPQTTQQPYFPAQQQMPQPQIPSQQYAPFAYGVNPPLPNQPNPYVVIPPPSYPIAGEFDSSSQQNDASRPNPTSVVTPVDPVAQKFKALEEKNDK